MKKEELLQVSNFIRNIIKDTQFENHVFFVGGCVRDTLIEKDINDIDIVVDLPSGGSSFGQFIVDKQQTKHSLVNFKRFNTCKFYIEVPTIGKVIVESTQTLKFFKSSKENKNEKNDVLGTIEEDAKTRDFTINALYWNISTNKIIDPTNLGMKDIINKVIRTCSKPDDTFNDDPLRMMRGVRIASQLGFKINRDTFRSMIKNNDLLKDCSMERIKDEFNKILLLEKPSVGLMYMKHTKLLKIFPEIMNMIPIKQGYTYSYNTVFDHTLDVIDKVKPILENRMSALLHDIGKTKTENRQYSGYVSFPMHESKGDDIIKTFLEKMKYSKELTSHVLKAVNNHMKLSIYSDSLYSVTSFTYRKLYDEFGAQFDLICDLIEADNNSKSNIYNKPNQINTFKNEIKKLHEKEGILQIPITQAEIIEHLNLNKDELHLTSKIFDLLKNELYREPVKTKEECFKFIEDKYDILSYSK